MATASASVALFDNPDQTKVVSDLSTFIGPKSDRYIQLYEEMRKAPTNKRMAVRSWNWVVFLTGFVWFFYRKQYVAGATALLAPIIASLLVGRVGNGATIVFAMFANTWYVQSALGRIAKADKLGLDGDARRDYLQHAGGTSNIAGGIAAFIFIAFLSLLILNAAGGHAIRGGG